jgi:hypothetical protein
VARPLTPKNRLHKIIDEFIEFGITFEGRGNGVGYLTLEEADDEKRHN